MRPPCTALAKKAMSDSVKLIEVIQVKTRKGDGTKNDPCRFVTEYWSMEGELLAVFDSLDDDSDYGSFDE